MESNQIPQHFMIKTDPLPNPEAVVTAGQARFVVLAPRLIRMEWSPVARFEERPSQAVWFRNQPCPKFVLQQAENRLEIETDALKLTYIPGQPFSAESLWIYVKEVATTWHYGDKDPGNLGGTARTLDEVDGATPIEDGLISRSGWSLVNDSNSLVFNENSWLEPRQAPAGQLDLYFFGYGHDYLGCLREFNLIAGSVPMIPRYVLGNWWSRYWKYSQDDVANLMADFERYQIPLSVCIIDMDWHITTTGNTSSGWTGYSWNRKLFPDPEALLKLLHERKLKVALNLHPADGIHPHEDDYEAMCRALEKDPALGEPVEFDITNPRFVNAYFDILHHPQEERGIDFWWMDWQQGVQTRLSGLDPLWWLNHLHFLDLGRDGKRRSFIFSRWGGLGNHRYPIGFSGDSIISWASLAFQPYFTATSSNVNYGWWSHDIGGHMGGVEDAELYARWVQMGILHPVFRLHSTNNEFLERRPWGYDAETLEVARAAMQLRHALIPYLYSMAWRYHRESIPPILPMYYEHPEQEDAYVCPNQYMFGSQLLAVPFISPRDADTRLSRALAWLPDGDWYDYFTGRYFPGGWHAVYGGLRDMPIFAKAGSIVPAGPMVPHGGVDTPEHLQISVFAGANGSFDLYEDEGNTNFYKEGAYAITPMCQNWSGNQTSFVYGPAQVETSFVPENRKIDLFFRGFNQPDKVVARLNGVVVELPYEYQADTFTLCLKGILVTPADHLEVKLISLSGSLANFADNRLDLAQRLIRSFRMENNAKSRLSRALPELISNPGGLGAYLSALTHSQTLALLEVICQAGLDISYSTGKPIVTLWNRTGDKQVTYQVSSQIMHQWWKFSDQFQSEAGVLPSMKSIQPESDFGEGNPWQIQINYYGICQNKINRPGE